MDAHGSIRRPYDREKGGVEGGVVRHSGRSLHRDKEINVPRERMIFFVAPES